MIKNYMKIFNFSIKLKKFLLLIIKAKFIFDEPNKADIIIFDSRASKGLSEVLKSFNHTFLSNRIEEIQKVFITKKIILFILENFFKRSLKINYLLCLIHIINPRILITRIDTSKDFHILSKILYKKIKCISLLQGDRTLEFQGMLEEKPDVSKKVMDKYFIPEFFVFSDYDKKIFHSSKAKVKKYEFVGSLTSSLAINYLKKKKKNFKKANYDFCLISDPHIDSPTGNIARYLHDVCKEENLSYVIAADTDLSNNLELNYYRNFLNNEKFNIIRNERGKYSSYLAILKSKVIIGHKSTMLRESLGLNKKVLSINAYPLFKKIGSSNIFSYKKRNNRIIWEQRKNSYQKFKNATLKIYGMPNQKYFKSLGNKEFLMKSNLNTVDIIKKKISNYLHE